MAEEKNNDITLDLDLPQKGRIKVHTQIINDLSSGIYSSPASCIKELVNNSYDADAKVVTIRVKPVHDSITIIDNGNGMNAQDFDNKFAWISHSSKRKDSQRSEKLDRPLIGKIGIGFIAVNEICNELEIVSSKEGEPFKFTSTVNFKKYFEDAAVPDENGEEGIIKGEYELINEDEEEEEHYTIIRLLGLKESVKDILDGKQYLDEILGKRNKNYHKVFFSSMKDLMDFHANNNLKSFSEDNAYVQFIIDLASYIPVEYIENGPIEGCYDDVIINSLIKRHKDLDLKVDLDGMYLKKPIFFPSSDSSQKHISFDETITVKEREGEENDEIHVKGYFYIQHGILFPRELNGVSIRIRNIPIAEEFGFDESFMKYPNYTNNIFRNWISGEIYIEKGLEEAMNIDRKSFRVTHPHYLSLQNFLHKILDENVFKIALEIYEKGVDVRAKSKEKTKKAEGKRILNTSKVKYQDTSPPKKPISKEGDPVTEEVKIDPAPIKIVKSSAQNTVVEVNQALVKKFKKKDWEYLENIFLIFESSFKESDGDTEKMRELFYKKINDWKEID